MTASIEHDEINDLEKQTDAGVIALGQNPAAPSVDTQTSTGASAPAQGKPSPVKPVTSCGSSDDVKWIKRAVQALLDQQGLTID